MNKSRLKKSPFAELKSKVTGANPLSFQQAVSALRPDLNLVAIKSDLKVARQENKKPICSPRAELAQIGTRSLNADRIGGKR